MKTLLVHVGLPKTGTTYLGEVLRATAGVSVSSIKEPQYLSNITLDIPPLSKLIATGNSWRGPAWYESLFRQKSEIWVDLSTQYWQSNDFTRPQKYNVVPFLIERERVDQLASYIKHVLRGYYSAKELNRILDSSESARKYFTEMRDYSAGANVHVISFEELTRDPLATVHKLLEITGRDFMVPNEAPNLEKKSNPAVKPILGSLNRFLFAFRGRRLQPFVPEKAYASLIALRKKIIKANSVPYQSHDAADEVAEIVSKIQNY